MPLRYVLVYQDQRVPLPDGDTIVGRSIACQVRFNAPTVSRQHLRLHVAGDRITAENLSSTTGTLLNGQRLVEPAPVHAGDQLTLGPREVRIDRVAPDELARLAPPPRPALGLLPDGGDDDEITLTEDVEAIGAAPLAPVHVEFHTCPRCRNQVPFHRAVCPFCGHQWPQDHPSARLATVTSRNVADEFNIPGEVMAVYASDVMTIDVTLSDLDRDRAFVPTELFDAPGTTCELTLLPEGQAPLVVRGEVVAAHPELPGKRPAGLEVRLVEMSDGTRLWIDLFARKRAR